MDDFEKLLGPAPSVSVARKIKSKIQDLVKHRMHRQLRDEKRKASPNDAMVSVMRALIDGDPKLVAMVKEIREKERARAAAWKPSLELPERRPKIESRIRKGSISATYGLPLETWQWDEANGDAGAAPSVNGNSGSINLSVSAGINNDSGNAAAQGALGTYFQLPKGSGVIQISASPALSADLYTDYFLESAGASGFVGLGLEQFTPDGEYVSTIINQQTQLASLPSQSSGLPLVAVSPIDGDQIYSLYVLAGVSVYGDGSEWWGGFSWAQATADVHVPSVSLHYFS
jgi:hypothetical protein